LNAHAPTEDKSEDTLAYFYKELQRVLAHFPLYPMATLSGDNTAKLLGEILTDKWERDFSRYIQDNHIRVANFAT
jgi:hypothetical protein